MKPSRNIHILPTDKLSRLYFFKGNNEYPTQYGLRSLKSLPFNDSIANQNIYITSDEFIDNDWVLNTIIGKVFFNNTKLDLVLPVTKKIILTTDPKLIENGVQAIDDEFLECFVKNPSCEEVEVNKSYSGTYYIAFPYKIIIPKEELEKETIEEVAKGILTTNGLSDEDMIISDTFLKVVNSMVDMARWQQQNNTSKVNRVEVIQHSEPFNGRAYTNYNAKYVEIQFQDNGKTLKIFLK
jgi:hypothetical protein